MLNKQGVQYTALTYSFSYLEPVCCSMFSSNCCSLTCIQISQEAGQVANRGGAIAFGAVRRDGGLALLPGEAAECAAFDSVNASVYNKLE